MNPKTSFRNGSQQAAGYYTLRFAGLFNLPITLRFAFVNGVSQIIAIAIPDDICFKHHIQIYRRKKHENK
jgi:hypothetical protein